MTNKKMRLSLAWLHANIKQELWKVTEEVCLKFSCPTAEAAGLICFTAAVFLHKSNNSAFFLSFAAISKLMPLYYKKFFTPHLI